MQSLSVNERIITVGVGDVGQLAVLADEHDLLESRQPVISKHDPFARFGAAAMGLPGRCEGGKLKRQQGRQSRNPWGAVGRDEA